MTGARLLTVGLAGACIAGCAGLLQSDLPPTRTYTLEAAPADDPRPAANSGVRIERIAAAPGLDTDRILLRREQHLVEHFSAVEWAAPAPALVFDFLQSQLPVTGAESAAVLRLDLREFHADYLRGDPPVIRVRVAAILLAETGGAPIAQFSQSASSQASANRMAEVVAAFHRALRELSDSLFLRVEQELARNGVGSN